MQTLVICALTVVFGLALSMGGWAFGNQAVSMVGAALAFAGPIATAAIGTRHG